MAEKFYNPISAAILRVGDSVNEAPMYGLVEAAEAVISARNAG